MFSRTWVGALHLCWKPASAKHEHAGFNPHFHLIAESRRPLKDADIDAIIRRWHETLGATAEDGVVDVVHVEPVRHLAKAAVYITHVRNLLPGYARDPRGHLLVRRMSPRDIVAFLRLTKGTQRLLCDRSTRSESRAVASVLGSEGRTQRDSSKAVSTSRRGARQ